MAIGSKEPGACDPLQQQLLLQQRSESQLSATSTTPTAEPAAEPAPHSSGRQRPRRLLDGRTSLAEDAFVLPKEAPPLPPPASQEVYAVHAHRNRTAQDAALRLVEEVSELRQQCCETARAERRLRVEEFHLAKLRAELQGTARAFRAREARAGELRAQTKEVEALLQDLSDDVTNGSEEIAQECQTICSLQQQVMAMRQACYLPAQLKRQSSAMTRSLDREGGRLGTQRRQRGLQVGSQLYKSVQVHAPQLLPLAGLAKASMEDEFARYKHLEERHARMLDWLQLAVAKDVLAQPEPNRQPRAN
eukprot:NODE_9783_length_1400_cov_2.371563.p1 GENE.NODE_9783_length_1400_cov_2.371563~~NODE_9783_length_1400_cov_2.371563.p1  ORF type:complete len:317 (-),score=105.47 NODE_9783_length_1400_cov_2.371563:448-1362(-)